MKTGILIAAALLAATSLSTCGKAGKELMGETAPTAPTTQAPAKAPPTRAEEIALTLPAGDYKLDPLHSTLVFKLSHLGFSKYTSQFTRFDAQLHFDPQTPTNTTLSATIDPASLMIPAPPEGFLDELKGAQWLEVAKFPRITYKSTRVEMVSANTAKIIGDLTLHGQTHPLELRATFNGGYVGHVYEPNARAGFSASGKFRRSDYGMSYGLPEPGSTTGVFDDVDVIIETEFTGPPMPQGATPVK